MPEGLSWKMGWRFKPKGGGGVACLRSKRPNSVGKCINRGWASKVWATFALAVTCLGFAPGMADADIRAVNCRVEQNTAGGRSVGEILNEWAANIDFDGTSTMARIQLVYRGHKPGPVRPAVVRRVAGHWLSFEWTDFEVPKGLIGRRNLALKYNFRLDETNDRFVVETVVSNGHGHRGRGKCEARRTPFR